MIHVNMWVAVLYYNPQPVSPQYYEEMSNNRFDNASHCTFFGSLALRLASAGRLWNSPTISRSQGWQSIIEIFKTVRSEPFGASSLKMLNHRHIRWF
jgi:hypothetical protein